MGACILCGKSAGFFYALHKDCYAAYQAAQKDLLQRLSRQLEHGDIATLASQMQAHVEPLGFDIEARQRCFIKALEDYVEQQPSAFKNDQTIQHWLDLITHLQLDERLFVDPYLISQQRNLPALRALQAGQQPSCNQNSLAFPGTLESDETLWWRFTQGEIKQKQAQQKQWSVVTQIIDNLRPGKANFVTQSLASGTLWLSNKRIYCELDDGLTSTDYREIYSCTPARNGVSIQLQQSSALPKNYECEDGRLLYQFVLNGLNAVKKELSSQETQED